ncbi:CKLF-like MARVEL transmembrane domain-containing protein 6 [Lingula anatina]|uniref:CKLF-like MARVEL transmembrane domain-containing protein 6 n=1 Tax=Lingula anatina TaxID=7574 RepID=A0A1S3IF51_LINAN|nr:CKLF-like MARVEL transmembrane domain-containing protein 6 [Lingula anatina]|eukprot:XP_013396862.1 CKLF-like MARVEL transmembrane domain-containing protein 6 [Lingula anatina]
MAGETVTARTTTAVGCYPQYLATVPGIFKIVEVVLSILVIICAAVVVNSGVSHYFPGLTFVEFVGIFSLVFVTVIIIFYMTLLVNKVPIWLLLEFIAFVILLLFWLAAFITAAVEASKYANWRNSQYAARVATIVFASLALVVFIVDFFFVARAWRGRPIFTTISTHHSSTTTTTTTTVTSETKY